MMKYATRDWLANIRLNTRRFSLKNDHCLILARVPVIPVYCRYIDRLLDPASLQV